MSQGTYSDYWNYHQETNPSSSRIPMPIQSSSTNFSSNANQKPSPDRLRLQDTSVQWINDPNTGREKFRATINIDGFHQNEVNYRVEGSKLLIRGEHVEIQNQSSTKKIIEKSIELPHDIDYSVPQATFPNLTTMFIDFPSRYSNVTYDNGSSSYGARSNYDVSSRSPPQLTQERTSTEFTSTRKIGGTTGNTSGSLYERNSSSRPYNAYEELKRDYNPNPGVSFSSDTYYQTVNDREIPSRSEQNSIYPSNTRSKQSSSSTYVNPPTELNQRMYRDFGQQSASPSVGTRTFDDDRFRKDPPTIDRKTTDPSLSHQVEIREYSRRLGANGQNTSDLPLFPRNFNSDAFFRSSFEPKIITDGHGQKMIEMKLDVSDYQPSEIKISVNGHDLVVQAEHSEQRPPSTSSRAYLFKQLNLPSNTDLASLSSQYHPDGKLHITAKLSSDRNLM